MELYLPERIGGLVKFILTVEVTEDLRDEFHAHGNRVSAAPYLGTEIMLVSSDEVFRDVADGKPAGSDETAKLVEDRTETQICPVFLCHQAPAMPVCVFKEIHGHMVVDLVPDSPDADLIVRKCQQAGLSLDLRPFAGYDGIEQIGIRMTDDALALCVPA